MKLPLIIINFKSYPESTGKNALKLSRICRKVSESFDVNIAVAPNFADIYRIFQEVKIPVFSQHVDPVDAGRFTGRITCLAIKEAGAIGSLINHSEKKLDFEDVKKCVELTRKYKLVCACFASQPQEAKNIALLNPDFVVIEPPELIASGISVSIARPEVVLQTVNIIKRVNPKIKVLCGAGITKGEDVKKAIELGTHGVVVSSGVVEAKNQRKILEEFAKTIKTS